MTQLTTTSLIALSAGVMSSNPTAGDATRNEHGVPWIHTTDDWGVPFADAATMFYSKIEQHRTWLAAQGVPADKMEFAVGTETSLRKVFHPKLWFHGEMTGVVRIAAARGQTEGFQLVICPIGLTEQTLTHASSDDQHKTGPLEPKTVKVNAIVAMELKGPQGAVIPADGVELSRVGYIRTVQPQYPVVNIGEWPDPLLPMEPFEVSNPFCQPVWVDIRVPRTATPGDYTGQIRVEGPHAVTIRVELTVWPFSLPLMRSFMTMGWALNDWFFKEGVDDFQRKVNVLLEHGLAPWEACHRFSKDLSAHDRVFRWFQEWGVKLQSMTTDNPDPNYIEHLRKRGWLQNFICIPGDEPHERDYPKFREKVAELHKKFPGLTIAMTEDPQPNNEGLFDLYIAEPTAQRDEYVRAAIQRGGRVWWYLCQLPVHATYPGPIWACPGAVLDRVAVDHRVVYWLAWRYGIEGVGFWAISAWPKGWEEWPGKPWPISPLSEYPYSGQHNGNGFLCYPYKDRVLPSVRLKVLRDGMNDYEYLVLLKELTGSQATERDKQLLAVPADVAVGLRYFNKDPNGILAARRELASRIVALGR
jgi:hypothetical protein